MSLSRHFTINLIGMAVPVLMVLISTPLYIHIIGAERYGLLAIVWLLLSYLAFMDFGFGRAVNNQLAKLPVSATEQRGALFWSALITSMLVGIIVGIAIWAGGDWFLSKYVDDPALQYELLKSLPWLAIGLPVILMTLICNGALEGCRRFDLSNILQSVASCFYQFLPLYFAWHYRPALDLIIQVGVLVRLVMLIGYITAVLKYCSIQHTPCFRKQSTKTMLEYGGWVALTGIISPLLEMADRLMIQTLRGAIPVAYYTVAYNLIRAVRIIPLGLGKTVFPRFSKGDNNDQLSTQSFQILLHIMTPLIACGIVGVEAFIDLWIREPDFTANAAPVAQIMLIGTWLNALAFIPYSQLQAEGRPKVVAQLHLIEIIPYLILLYFAVQHYGVMGAAAVWSVRLIIDCFLLFYLSGQLVYFKNIIPAFLCISIAVISLFMTPATLLSRALVCFIITVSWGGYTYRQFYKRNM